MQLICVNYLQGNIFYIKNIIVQCLFDVASKCGNIKIWRHKKAGACTGLLCIEATKLIY